MMKAWLSAGALAMSGFAAATVSVGPAQAQVLRINPDKTRILFEIDAVGWPRTRGMFRKFDGNISINVNDVARSSVTFSVIANSVDVGAAAVTDFVKSPSMLYVQQFPEIRFRSRSVERTGPATVSVTGDMSLMGQTRPAIFNVEVDQARGGGKLLGFVARGTLKRSDFGFISGQPLISDEVRITVTTEAASE